MFWRKKEIKRSPAEIRNSLGWAKYYLREAKAGNKTTCEDSIDNLEGYIEALEWILGANKKREYEEKERQRLTKKREEILRDK